MNAHRLCVILLFTMAVFVAASCQSTDAQSVLRHAAARFPDNGNAVRLLEAACRGDETGISEIATSGADLNAQTVDGISLLQLALDCSSPQGITALVKAGADPNLPDKAGRTPFAKAAGMADSKMLEAILKGDGNPRQGSAKAMIAAATDAFDARNTWRNLDLLVEHGLDVHQLDGPSSLEERFQAPALMELLYLKHYCKARQYITAGTRNPEVILQAVFPDVLRHSSSEYACQQDIISVLMSTVSIPQYEKWESDFVNRRRG